MKKILIIDGHPDPDSSRFVHALAAAYESAARDAGHEVRRLEVASAGIDALRSAQEWEKGETPPAVKQAQEAITWAEHVVILFPLWLGALPALLKGFFEQVFRPGYAIGKGKRTLSPGLLTGRSARVVVTMGMPGYVYRWFFFAHNLRSLRRNILYFVGIKPVHETIIGTVESAAAREKGLATMRALGREGR